MRFRSLCTLLLLAAPLLQAQTPQRPAITGVAFIRVYTTNPTAAATFYGPTMGFAQKSMGDTLIYPVNHSQWIEVLTGTPPPTPTSRLAAIAFTTADPAALERYLAAHGVQPTQPLQAGSFSVGDPEGNTIVFVGNGDSGPAAHIAATSTPLPSATSTRIIHVGFTVRDRAREDAFWQTLLGFRPYWHGGQTDSSTDYVSLQVPDGTDWLEYMLNNPASLDLRTNGVMDHVSLGVDHMQTVLAGLQRNGCAGKMCTAIQAGRDGKIQLNLYDPDQTRVEYMEFRPVMKPCCSDFTGTHPSNTDTVK